MWYPAIIKEIWPQWKIKTTIKEEQHSAVYEVEEKGLGSASRSMIHVVSLGLTDDVFGKLLMDPHYGESLLKQKLADAFQDLSNALGQVKEKSFNEPLLKIQEMKLERNEEGTWQLLLLTEAFPSLNTIYPQGKIPQKEVLKMGTDLAEALETYEDLDLVHGHIDSENVFITPLGEYKLGLPNLVLALKQFFPPEISSELILETGGRPISRREEDLEHLGLLLSSYIGGGTPQEQQLQEIIKPAMFTGGDNQYRSPYELRRKLEAFSLDYAQPSIQEVPLAEEHVQTQPIASSRKREEAVFMDKRPKASSKAPYVIAFILLLLVGGIALLLMNMGIFSKDKVDLAKIPQIENRSFVSVDEGKNVTISLANGNKVKGRYYGEMKNGQPEGQGAFMALEGESIWTYSGQWKDGLFDGEGKYITKDGSYYFEGSISRGKAEGTGHLYDTSLGEYWGEYKNDNFHGKGKIIYQNGDVYEGDFKEGYRNGQGTYIWSNGDKYVGEYLDGVIQGKGIYTWIEGDIYEGEWINGKKDGQGKLIYQNGDVYEGSFKEDLLHGQGTINWIVGGSYSGQWENNLRTGSGEENWTDGSRYSGEYKENKRSGFGTHYYPNGDHFEGYWVEGQRHGEGIYTWSTGEIYKGQYENGVRSGQGIYYDSNGNVVSDGRWVNDVFVGE